VLRLEDATRLALRKQPQVLAARASVEAQLGRKDQARAPMLPQVTGTASAIHAYGALARSGASATTGAAATSPAAAPSTGQYDYFSFGATATQLLWDFGQNYRKYESATSLSESLRETERAVALGVLVNVRRAFFLARAQRALIQVAEETLANNEKHKKQVEGFVSVGTRPEIDLAQAKSDVANARVLLVTAQNGYDVAKAQLSQAAGGIDGAFEVADEELPPVDGEDQPLDALVSRALAERPELTALTRQRDANERTIEGLKGGYLPTLSAQAGASTAGLGLDVLQPAWNVGAVASWPVFQGGLTRGQLREAEANRDGTDAQVESGRLQIRFDVEGAWLTVKGAKATIAAAEEARVNANERLRLAEGRYGQGVGTIIELGDAQVAKTNADATLVSAQFSLSSARAQLLSALGRR
jgi:outer membrane protein